VKGVKPKTRKETPNSGKKKRHKEKPKQTWLPREQPDSQHTIY
jgi:hypothetical protein